ncbi:MAG: hypothetical protein KatS3mg105_0553 [Gemmatales bacterium]|nr:MAG: hypothetical protein KatS3mg105_0553 [Gemmatales bacterium]
MQRRAFLETSLGYALASPLLAAVHKQRWGDAVDVLEQAVAKKQVESAVLHVIHKGESFTRAFGKAGSPDAMFLIASISKPINVAAVMTLYDQKQFRLDDPVRKYLPQFTGEGRDKVTIRHLLTHVSGLPDQLPNNQELRKQHAPLSEFVKHALEAKLAFVPGTKYQYSSMGILLAVRIAEVLTDMDHRTLVERKIFQPLGMKHSAQGLGRFQLSDMVPCQLAGAAPESGSGDPKAKYWDWNSLYWRKLGVPWGGTHSSGPDVGRFLLEFLEARGQALKPATARLMIRNHNPKGIAPRGLGFNVGEKAGSPGCSPSTFGHTGSTGTLCWADPETKTVCVVLTSLPARAARPHPRALAAAKIAAAVRR